MHHAALQSTRLGRSIVITCRICIGYFGGDKPHGAEFDDHLAYNPCWATNRIKTRHKAKHV